MAFVAEKTTVFGGMVDWKGSFLFRPMAIKTILFRFFLPLHGVKPAVNVIMRQGRGGFLRRPQEKNEDPDADNEKRRIESQFFVGR